MPRYGYCWYRVRTECNVLRYVRHLTSHVWPARQVTASPISSFEFRFHAKSRKLLKSRSMPDRALMLVDELVDREDLVSTRFEPFGAAARNFLAPSVQDSVNRALKSTTV